MPRNGCCVLRAGNYSSDSGEPSDVLSIEQVFNVWKPLRSQSLPPSHYGGGDA
jgi:hypothetical protein